MNLLIDPAPGGRHEGMGPRWGATAAADVSLGVGLALEAALAGGPVAASMTRRDQGRIPVKARVRLARNADAALVLTTKVDLWQDSGRVCTRAEEASPCGLEVLWLMGAARTLGREVAAALRRTLALQVWERGGYRQHNVLSKSGRPALLVVCGHLHSAALRERLDEGDWIPGVAAGLAAGVRSWMGRRAMELSQQRAKAIPVFRAGDERDAACSFKRL